MKVNRPPLMGSGPMLLPQQDGYLVSYNIPKTRVDSFVKTAKDRHLVSSIVMLDSFTVCDQLQFVENLAHKKLSKTPSELLPDIVKASEDGTEWVCVFASSIRLSSNPLSASKSQETYKHGKASVQWILLAYAAQIHCFQMELPPSVGMIRWIVLPPS